MAAYHQKLRIKYERAARSPWLAIEPDPPLPDPPPSVLDLTGEITGGESRSGRSLELLPFDGPFVQRPKTGVNFVLIALRSLSDRTETFCSSSSQGRQCRQPIVRREDKEQGLTMRTVAVINAGGVCKTTAAFCLAVEMANLNKERPEAHLLDRRG